MVLPTLVVAVTFAGAVWPVAVTPTVVTFCALKGAVALELTVSVEVPLAPAARSGLWDPCRRVEVSQV